MPELSRYSHPRHTRAALTADSGAFERVPGRRLAIVGVSMMVASGAVGTFLAALSLFGPSSPEPGTDAALAAGPASAMAAADGATARPTSRSTPPGSAPTGAGPLPWPSVSAPGAGRPGPAPTAAADEPAPAADGEPSAEPDSETADNRRNCRGCQVPDRDPEDPSPVPEVSADPSPTAEDPEAEAEDEDEESWYTWLTEMFTSTDRQ